MNANLAPRLKWKMEGWKKVELSKEEEEGFDLEETEVSTDEVFKNTLFNK